MQRISLNILILIFSLAAFLPSCKTSSTLGDIQPQTEIRPVSEIEQLESTVLLIDATKQKLLGNWANAVVLYAEAVKRDPKNSAALFELAKIHAQQGHMRDAERFAVQACYLDPGNIYYQMALADIYFLQEKSQQGMKVQEDIARRYPNNLNLQISLLSTYVYLQKFEDAIGVLDHLELISGFNDELSMQKQRLYLMLNRSDLAIEEAKRLISYYPGETQYLELLAELYTEAGFKEEAYKIYKQMLDIQPDNAMARLLLADYYTSTDQTENAFEELKFAFSNPELGVEGKARILYSYYELSENDEKHLRQAYELCDILLEVHPNDAQANALYGDFLYRDEKLEEARVKYLKASEIDPSEVGFWQQILVIDSRLSNYHDMLEISDKALEYFFEHPVIYLFNGIANLQLKNYEDAISAFDYGKNLSLSNKDLYGQFLTLLGDTYYKTGDHNASFKSYEAALTVTPENQYALNNYAYYLSLRNENLLKALEMSTLALKLEPDNSAYQDTYGWIKYKLGNYEEAEIWIKKALDSSEKPGATVLEHYGDVLYKLGKKEKALEYWVKALETDGDDVDEVSEFLEKKIRDKTLYE